MNRRGFLGACAAAAGAATAGCMGRDWRVSGGATSTIADGTTVGLEHVAGGFTEPLDVAFHPDRKLRYVADKFGTIHVFDGDGVRDAPFLDLRDRLLPSFTTIEQGLLGLALHPEYARNRKFYVRYSAPLADDAPDLFSHTFVLSEFEAAPDFDAADPNSERVLLAIPQPGPNHNSGAIVFGPDGYLYVGVGDGSAHESSTFGRSRDVGPGHPLDWYPVNKGGNGQDVSRNLLGSVLRIDVDREGDDAPYAIPPDNPLVGEPGLDEHYAWGFRNPYRMSFDGDRLFVGDVGFYLYEEVNVVEKGGNYGWNVREGPSCFNANTAFTNGIADDLPGPLATAFSTFPLSLVDEAVRRFTPLARLPACPSRTPDGEPLIDPVVAYPHERRGELVGSAVIGGHVYRNATVEPLRDRYVFGDFIAENSGRIFAAPADTAPGSPWPVEEVLVAGSETGRINEAVYSFGRDPAGELYVLSTRFAEGSGNVYKIVAAP